jgi:archaellum component FlaC
MPPKTKKRGIGKRELKALGVPLPAPSPDPVDVDVNVEIPPPASAAAEPNRSESMVMVTPEEQQQQQQQQPWDSPEAQEPSGYSLSPIAAADESMNQTDSDYVAQVSPRFNMMDSSDSSMGSSPTPLIRKMLGMKKKSPRRSPSKSPKRRNSPVPRRKSSPRRNTPRAQTFRRRKLSIDKPEYLKASPSVVQIRDRLMSLAQVASRTRRNSVKINEYAEKIRMTLDELNPYFSFIQRYIAGRGEIQRELDVAVEDRNKLMGERERLVGDLADKAQVNANNKIQEVAEGQIGILNDKINGLNKRIEELTAQLEAATKANQMYENILRDIPADIDKMRSLIDAEDATLSENITALDQVLSNFSNQLKQRLQDTLPPDQHGEFNAARGGGGGGGRYKQSKKHRKMTRKSIKKSIKKSIRKSRKQRKMTRKSKK